MILAKYNEVMEHIEVTDEMRTRILNNVGDRQVAKKTASFRRWIPLAAAACLVLVIGVLWRGAVPSQPDNDPGVQVAYEEIVCADAAELAQVSGLPVWEPTLPFESTETSYSYLFHRFAQIVYNGANGEQAMYRVEEGTDDISGDYNDYADVREVPSAVGTVTLKGEDGLYSLALWTAGGYSYSLSLAPAQPEDVWLNTLGK